MKREILLKAYVVHQSDEAFRELVAISLDEVYTIALRLVHEVSPLAEETAVRVFWELERKAPTLDENVNLGSWLREHTCKTAALVLREEDHVVDRAVLKDEMRTSSASAYVEPAPRGLATRVCQGVLLNAARRKQPHVFPLPTWWIQRAHIRVGALSCFLVALILWNVPFHRRNPIIQSPDVQVTPASFAQLGSPEDEGLQALPGSREGAEIHPNP